ncbi:MAG: hypothetical protein WD894_26740 [Pirellulales bacterium]
MSQADSYHAALSVSPLESFMRDYAEVSGGAWEEVEPQVYDLLLAEQQSGGAAATSGIIRVAFDPEALPEHPGAQLASFGTPLVDRLLSAAVERGQFAQAYFNGLNLAPYDLPRQVRRTIALPAGLVLEIERTRPLHVAQAVFWFQAEFVSDQKEYEILPIALDLHSGRQVRRLEQLLDFSRLAEQPAEYLVEARRMSRAEAYNTARDAALRTLSALANVRRRELAERVERQVQRMESYYRDLRSELIESMERARKRNEDVNKYGPRLEALDRERRLRIAETRQKSALAMRLRLLSLLVVQQPKLIVKAQVRRAEASAAAGGLAELELVWDPLVESLEAAACPVCRNPTYAFELTRRGSLACAGCKGASPASGT